MSSVDWKINDFTEESYRKFLKKAKKNYNFKFFDEYQSNNNGIVLWRHDVDFSLHRALRLAQIESECDIKSTFFIHLHNEFYNPLELVNSNIVQEIMKLGHKIGVHFDPLYYQKVVSVKTEEIEKYLDTEKKLFQMVYGVDVNVFSFHNPTPEIIDSFKNEIICGMINTYSEYFMKNYGYCSDSNGYWRFESLDKILESREDKLQILTHPAWWTPEAMKPRERIQRCLDGRSESVGKYYDEMLKKFNRVNIGG